MAQALKDALAAWRERKTPFATAELDEILGGLRNETDAKLVQTALAALIESPGLDLAGLEHVARFDAKLVKSQEPLIRRTYLARRLDEAVTDEVIQQVVASRDASVQSKLVRDPRLSRKQAELLAKQGANPTIRANAQAWVKDKKAWKA